MRSLEIKIAMKAINVSPNSIQTDEIIRDKHCNVRSLDCVEGKQLNKFLESGISGMSTNLHIKVKHT